MKNYQCCFIKSSINWSKCAVTVFMLKIHKTSLSPVIYFLKGTSRDWLHLSCFLFLFTVQRVKWENHQYNFSYILICPSFKDPQYTLRFWGMGYCQQLGQKDMSAVWLWSKFLFILLWLNSLENMHFFGLWHLSHSGSLIMNCYINCVDLDSILIQFFILEKSHNFTEFLQTWWRDSSRLHTLSSTSHHSH